MLPNQHIMLRRYEEIVTIIDRSRFPIIKTILESTPLKTVPGLRPSTPPLLFFLYFLGSSEADGDQIEAISMTIILVAVG